VKIILKTCLQFTGPTPHGFTWGLVLLKDLPKTTNTVWYFHAQIKNERKWTMTKITGFKKKKSVFVGPMPYGFRWGLVLLKDLPKTPIPFGIFMPKSKMKENGQ
jgi:hypothetical protein